MLLLSPSPGNQRGGISNLLSGGKFSSTHYFGHNSCCNWAFFLSWVDFSGNREMWQGKSYVVVEGAGTAIYNQDVKNISHTSLSMTQNTLFVSQMTQTLYFTAFMATVEKT